MQKCVFILQKHCAGRLQFEARPLYTWKILLLLQLTIALRITSPMSAVPKVWVAKGQKMGRPEVIQISKNELFTFIFQVLSIPS